MGQIQRKVFGYMKKKTFFDQTSERGANIPKIGFRSKIEPHTVKLSFSGVLKHFRGNRQKKSLLIQKSNYLRN